MSTQDPEVSPGGCGVAVFIVLLIAATHGLAFLAGWSLR